jgi:riboflavin kinase/FMN adenylyltransferase
VRIVRHPTASPSLPHGGRRALAIGSFDGVHRGHAAILGRVVAEARKRGIGSAILTFEPLPREFFSPDTAPGRLTSLRERLELVAAIGIDTAYVQRFDARFARLAPREFEQRLRDAYGCERVFVGADFRYGAGRAGDAASLADAGARLGFGVEIVEAVEADGERVSSTRIRAALARGDFDSAARWLGRRYSITGRVVHGDKRGHGLGFPTANVRLARPRPALGGIFAVKCLGAATRGLEGVASLGINPAVRDGGPATLEAFLFDFSGDLYGRRLTIEFVKKLRDEAHFASLDLLAAQIRRDCDAAREVFRTMES